MLSQPVAPSWWNRPGESAYVTWHLFDVWPGVHRQSRPSPPPLLAMYGGIMPAVWAM